MTTQSQSTLFRNINNRFMLQNYDKFGNICKVISSTYSIMKSTYAKSISKNIYSTKVPEFFPRKKKSLDIDIVMTTLNLNKERNETNNNSGVAYLLQNSNNELMKESLETFEDITIPSLRIQALHIDPDSCRFRDENIIREYDWEQSWNHCGNCKSCKPPETDGGEPVVQHPTINT